jgi:hypothetical protein
MTEIIRDRKPGDFVPSRHEAAIKRLAEALGMDTRNEFMVSIKKNERANPVEDITRVDINLSGAIRAGETQQGGMNTQLASVSQQALAMISEEFAAENAGLAMSPDVMARILTEQLKPYATPEERLNTRTRSLPIGGVARASSGGDDRFLIVFWQEPERVEAQLAAHLQEHAEEMASISKAAVVASFIQKMVPKVEPDSVSLRGNDGPVSEIKLTVSGGENAKVELYEPARGGALEAYREHLVAAGASVEDMSDEHGLPAIRFKVPEDADAFCKRIKSRLRSEPVREEAPPPAPPAPDKPATEVRRLSWGEAFRIGFGGPGIGG